MTNNTLIICQNEKTYQHITDEEFFCGALNSIEYHKGGIVGLHDVTINGWKEIKSAKVIFK